MNIGIYIYDQVEVLDFSGPFEVFSTSSRVCTDEEPFTVCLLGERKGMVNARGGFRVAVDYTIDHHPELDVLIIAGGVHTAELSKTHVLQWVAAQAKQVKIIASVCTGVFLLAEAGVLTREKVTTHWEDIPDLRSDYPSLSVKESVRWVDEGWLVTSGGISAGIDMALHLVSRLVNKQLAESTAKQMEFHWTENQ